jgi:hypothetical protein
MINYMDITRFVNELLALPERSQVETLIRFAYELTLVGRDTYVPGSVELRHPQRLRAINELQHVINSHVRALLMDDSRRYPDEVLVAIILEENDPELGRQIAEAFARSLPQSVV